jgi:hypothetical protein
LGLQARHLHSLLTRFGTLTAARRSHSGRRIELLQSVTRLPESRQKQEAMKSDLGCC